MLSNNPSINPMRKTFSAFRFQSSDKEHRLIFDAGVNPESLGSDVARKLLRNGITPVEDAKMTANLNIEKAAKTEYEKVFADGQLKIDEARGVAIYLRDALEGVIPIPKSLIYSDAVEKFVDKAANDLGWKAEVFAKGTRAPARSSDSARSFAITSNSADRIFRSEKLDDEQKIAAIRQCINLIERDLATVRAGRNIRRKSGQDNMNALKVRLTYANVKLNELTNGEEGYARLNVGRYNYGPHADNVDRDAMAKKQKQKNYADGRRDAESEARWLRSGTNPTDPNYTAKMARANVLALNAGVDPNELRLPSNVPGDLRRTAPIMYGPGSLNATLRAGGQPAVPYSPAFAQEASLQKYTAEPSYTNIPRNSRPVGRVLGQNIQRTIESPLNTPVLAEQNYKVEVDPNFSIAINVPDFNPTGTFAVPSYKGYETVYYFPNRGSRKFETPNAEGLLQNAGISVDERVNPSSGKTDLVTVRYRRPGNYGGGVSMGLPGATGRQFNVQASVTESRDQVLVRNLIGAIEKYGKNWTSWDAQTNAAYKTDGWEYKFIDTGEGLPKKILSRQKNNPTRGTWEYDREEGGWKKYEEKPESDPTSDALKAVAPK
ncbi:MAG: hypothetical protein JWM56_935 [Candidatus Peribacteria bacterium]|nr:hypothetical protein [Candidatus Peribacteria bacterium]